MSFLRNRIGLAALMIAAGMMLVPVSAQAACNGGACPLTGGTLRTLVGGGFIIPQVPSVFPFTGPAGVTLPGFAPVPGQMGFGNTAMGAIRVVPGAQVTISGSPPYSIMMPLKQMTYGSAASPAAPGYFTTPTLVQVPLNNLVPALMGVSTNIGQSFPGETRTFMNGPGFKTTIGGPAHFQANGRPGAATLTYCAGANVPEPIPATWTGSCSGFTPLTPGGQPGAQIAPVLTRYTKTTNQFGGVATQRQVERKGNLPGSAGNTWLGRINFNNFVAPYTAAQMANTALIKVYPTLPQNLVEPVVWGAKFGAVVQRFGAAPGNMVSAFLTVNGAPQNTATVMVTPTGTNMGLVQTSTSWGGPLTTGMVTVQVIAGGTVAPSTFTQTGNDQRTAGGQGMVSMVSGSIAARNLSGPGTQRTMLTLQLPEPSMALGLVAGVAVLVGVSRRRNR